jgi:polyisoprenyl-phosphate glycosyltransferase
MKNVVIVIPALNEAATIEENLSEILRHTAEIPEICFSIMIVNDGSTDETATIVLQRAKRDNSVRLLSLSRHFGKEAAIFAGLCNAKNFDAVIVMDSDLQHPPSLIAGMLRLWQQGFQVVEAVKTSRGNESLTKSFLVRCYYRLFNFLTTFSISSNTDFKLLDKSVVSSYCELSEQNRFFRGLIKWMNFPSANIYFNVPPSNKPTSSWGSFSLIRYAIASIASFTAFPLQIVTLLGSIIFLISLVIGGIALADKLSGNAVDGFTTVILLILIIGSILMFSVGMIGIYVGKIYDEVKRRPSYMIDKRQSNWNERP